MRKTHVNKRTTKVQIGQGHWTMYQGRYIEMDQVIAGMYRVVFKHYAPSSLNDRASTDSVSFIKFGDAYKALIENLNPHYYKRFI